MKRQFVKKPVLASSRSREFLRYHDDPENFRNNEENFYKMYDILEKYGSEDEDVDVVFDRASDEDQKKMLSLIKPVTASQEFWPYGDAAHAKKVIERAIDLGTTYDDVDDYLNCLYVDGMVDDEEFSELINWAAIQLGRK